MKYLSIIDPIHPAGVARIGAGHRIVEAGDPRTEILVVRTTAIGDALFAQMPKLRLIVKHGAGVDNIDIAAATRRGIMIANTPGGNNSTAVAEGAVTLMLATLRRVREMDAVVRENRWGERWATRLGDLTGARVGLIGFGRIARHVAQICGAGFGCSILAYDPMLSAEEIEAHGATAGTLDDILGCDVISVHVPLTEATRNLIGTGELAKMQLHSIIVNSSRGGIIDEAALACALSTGAIGGAGIDVFEAEPPPAIHPLYGLPNVTLSPHVAGVTEASMKGMAFAVADVIDTVVAGGVPDTLVNPDYLKARA
jgi:D-3-phosphoglycerate dehydrogenase / 2-oxoglutarate reductase